jgi:hypothetical protein
MKKAVIKFAARKVATGLCFGTHEGFIIPPGRSLRDGFGEC